MENDAKAKESFDFQRKAHGFEKEEDYRQAFLEEKEREKLQEDTLQS